MIFLNYDLNNFAGAQILVSTNLTLVGVGSTNVGIAVGVEASSCTITLRNLACLQNSIQATNTTLSIISSKLDRVSFSIAGGNTFLRSSTIITPRLVVRSAKVRCPKTDFFALHSVIFKYISCCTRNIHFMFCHMRSDGYSRVVCIRTVSILACFFLPQRSTLRLLQRVGVYLS